MQEAGRFFLRPFGHAPTSAIGTSLHALRCKKFGRYWMYSGLFRPFNARS